jgi:hypothetical protein
VDVSFAQLNTLHYLDSCLLTLIGNRCKVELQPCQVAKDLRPVRDVLAACYFASMTFYEFNALPYERQLVHVFDEGTFLVRRWEEEDGINL